MDANRTTPPDDHVSPADAFDAAAVERTAARYRGAGRFARHYVAGKLRRDPVHGDLLSLAGDGFGRVVDAGCGRGQLGLLLLEAGAARSVTGLDRNDAHLRAAVRAAEGLPFRAERRDLAGDPALPEADTVLLIDILYQLGTAAQTALVRAAAAAARRRVLVRTPDPGQRWRGPVTRALEIIGRPVWPHAGARVNARPIVETVAPLEACGFAVTVAPCWRGTPFANVLLVAVRA